MNWNEHAFSPIRKADMQSDTGVQASFYGLEVSTGDDSYHLLNKPVSESYLLIPNAEVKEVAEDIIQAMNWEADWDNERVMFDGNKFSLFMPLKNHLIGEVQEGDTIRSGLMFNNSYDMSKAFSFSFYLERLICLNGMTSNQLFSPFRFKHSKSSENWREEIDKVILHVSRMGESFDSVLNKFRNMTEVNVDHDWFNQNISKFSTIPSNLLAPTLTNFYQQEDKSVWGLLNAGTKTMWHKSDGNQFASIKHNTKFVDTLIGMS